MIEIKVITREQAKALHLTRYFTNKPCKHGHLAERYTSGGSCQECLQVNNTKQRAHPRHQPARPENWRELERARRNIKQQVARSEKDPDLAVRRAANAAAKSAVDAAVSQGLTTYQSTRACAAGHIGMRQVINSTCVTCAALRRQDIVCKRSLGIPRVVQYHAAKKARLEAIATGSKTYSGAPCKYGHDATRYVTGWACVRCVALRVIADAQNKKTYDAKRRATHAASLRLLSTTWKKANPEKRQAISQNYKHKRRAQEASGMTGRDLGAWKRAADKVCAYCKVNCLDKFHVDHVMPLALGGLHEAGNLAIACPSCNQRKSAKHPDVFRQEITSTP